MRKLVWGPFSVLIVLIGAGTVSGSWAGPSTPPATPDGTVRFVSEGLAQSQPVVAWRSLPPSWQREASSLIHEVAAKVDPGAWKRTFGVLVKAGRILSEKRDFLLSSPLLAAQMGDRAQAEEAAMAAAAMLDALARSELADPQAMRTLDVDAFLSGTGARLMRRVFDASALARGTPLASGPEAFRVADVTVVSAEGDHATVRVKRADGSSSEETWVRIENRWVPGPLADAWPSMIAKVRGWLDTRTEQGSGSAGPYLEHLGRIEVSLDTMLAAKSSDQFAAGLGAAFGALIGAVAPHLGASGVEDSGLHVPVLLMGHETVAQSPSEADEIIPSAHRIDVAEAGRHLGKSMHVKPVTGAEFDARLVKATARILVFERDSAGGPKTQEIAASDIAELSVWR